MEIPPELRDNGAVASGSKKSKDSYLGPAGIAIKMFLFIFVLFLAVTSDGFIRVMSKAGGLVEEGTPTLRGQCVQGALLATLYLVLHSLITHEVL